MFNGLGQFIRLFSWQNDAAANIDIMADRMDDEMDGMATGLSTCITKDGQTQPTADLPMNGNKHTNVENADARNQYAAVGQVQDSSFIWCGTASGTASALIAGPTPTITAYVEGQALRFIPSLVNTGAATITISGLTAKAITRNGTAPLRAGDLVAGQVCSIVYDGTQFQLINLATVDAGSGPAFSVRTSINQTIPTGVITKVTCNTVEFDTANAYTADPTYRFRPLTAGYYMIGGGAGSGSTFTSNYVQLGVSKNGIGIRTGTVTGPETAFGGGQVTALVFLNGSTDYVELAISHDAAGSQDFGCYFHGHLIRTA